MDCSVRGLPICFYFTMTHIKNRTLLLQLIKVSLRNKLELATNLFNAEYDETNTCSAIPAIFIRGLKELNFLSISTFTLSSKH